ncbi:MAG: MBL fold metallo-hydrolase [Gammaproteobacteria bacterium]|nr:MBL fold metallo-hydrolase [Gammaproteobacteria bacterium]
MTINLPTMFETRRVTPDTDALCAYVPLPGYGVLPVYAFVIHAAEPVLVDTGLAALREDLLQALAAVIDPAELRWIWVTHMDADHIGNLEAVLTRADSAKVVTTYLGMGKMGLMGLPAERAWLLNPGQSLELGDRRLEAIVPPSYDAPETTGLYDSRSRALFSADCFGALMQEPAESAAAIEPGALRDGLVTWTTVDAPWLSLADDTGMRAITDCVRRLDPEIILGSHLPPAHGMMDTLLGHLDAARSAPRFEGPDQTALERMMAGQAT